MPLTLPVHVVPEYGTRIWLGSRITEPESEMAHDGTVLDVPLPVATQVIDVPESVPRAVPVTLNEPWHVALNVPAAVVAVRSVICHLKLVQTF